MKNLTELEKKDSAHSPINFVSEPKRNSQAPNPSDQPNVTSFAAYSGPIPPPHFLVEYEKLLPGIAIKFLEEPHREAEHRRSLEKMMVQKQVELASRGQIMAFVLASLCVILAFIAIFFGYSLAGLGVLVTSIASFVYAFCYEKKRQ